MYETLLKKILEEKGISIRAFASVCNVSRSAMYNYVNGLRKPPLDEAQRIMRALNMDNSRVFDLFVSTL